MPPRAGVCARVISCWLGAGVTTLQALDLDDTRVNRNRINRWRLRFRWDQREADRLAAEAARTDEALAKRRRDIQTLALGVTAR